MADLTLSIHDDGRFARLTKLAGVVEDRYTASRALLAGARVVRDRAAELAPVESGRLRRNLIAWTNWPDEAAPLSAFVTVRGAAARADTGGSGRGAARSAAPKGGEAPAFYGGFVEHGHFVRRRGEALRGGERKKREQRAALAAMGAPFVAPRPFLRPAFDQSGELAAIAAERRLLADIQAFEERL